MKPIESTYEILAWKHFNLPVDEKWINWAVKMLIEGFETEHLIELTGILKPLPSYHLRQSCLDIFFSIKGHLFSCHQNLDGFILITSSVDIPTHTSICLSLGNLCLGFSPNISLI
ncbi:MAG: hypothetical protein ACPG3Z_05270, partial [Saprospiraceae bacterium]